MSAQFRISIPGSQNSGAGSPAAKRANQCRTTSTFSRDIAYSRSPAASRAEFRIASSASCSWCCALEDGFHTVDQRQRFLHRVGGVDLYRVPLHEAALQGEVSDRINVVRLDDREDDVVRAEDAQRDDIDAELLGELRDLARTLLQYLSRLRIGGRAEVGGMLGDEGECCHDVSLLLSVVEASVAAVYFANLSPCTCSS